MMARGRGKDDGTRYETIGSGLRRPEQWRREGEDEWAAKRDGSGWCSTVRSGCCF